MLKIFIFERVGVDGGLIIEYIDVSIPLLVVLMEVIQELLVYSIALTFILLLFVGAAKSNSTLSHVLGTCKHLFIADIEIYVLPQLLYINNLALALEADISCWVVLAHNDLLLCAELHHEQPLLFLLLVDELPDLVQRRLQHAVVDHLVVRVHREMGVLSSHSVASFVGHFGEPPLHLVFPHWCELSSIQGPAEGRAIELIVATFLDGHVQVWIILIEKHLRLARA